MILIDANILLYAYGSASPHHERARRWLEEVLSASEPVRLAWVTILAFLRISTHPQIPGERFSTAEAVAIVTEWLERPNAGILQPGDGHWQIINELLISSQTRGALVTDAHLAALAIEHGATLCTHDRDFSRFEGLKVAYPLV